MPDCVVDASVVLAALLAETGWQIAADLLPGAVISSANLAEVATRLSRDGLDRTAISQILATLPFTVIDLARDTAVSAGAMEPLTKRLGLSLGDRICLCLACEMALPVYTADRDWLLLKQAVGTDIRLIR